ncbi:Tat pathway signal sequence [Xiamenia xianingshaonis]|uniref:Tat pathway signal sequence n=1 Tax=Xiamenia xianingshaonis TaxID=2682776 RepID=UPI0021BD5AEB|nr:Tat pathway signal sequence [Xiamenia xianingshaonis]
MGNNNDKTGFENLIDALKQSGINMDGRFDGPPPGGAGSGSAGSGGSGSAGGGAGDASGGSGSGSSGGQGGSRGHGGFNFGGFNFGGGNNNGGSGGKGGDGGNGNPFVDIDFADKMAGWGKKAIIVAIVVIFIIAAAAYWWFHPPINIHSVDTWTFVAVVVLLPLLVFFSVKHHAYQNGSGRIEPDQKKAKTFKGLMVIPLAVALVGVLGAVLSMPIVPGNAEKYSSVLKTDTLEFAQDIKEVDYSEIPVIDRASAILLGNREMGSIPEYVSQFEISDMYSQINYKGEPVRVSPLGYADLFKWFTNREGGIPAYALVNMTTQDAEIVRLGDSPIHYSQSEPLVRNIDRHVQLRYPFYMFGEKSFEIDEEGNPWWICPVKNYTIGLFGGETISRVVLVNATTGECQDLAVEDCPQWVDRVYPADLLVKQYNWFGAYHNGWLNSFLGQEGVVRTTPGTDGTLGYNYIAKDDDVWVYTGVTSATADKSIIGFVLVNQRTQESHFYSVSGATEDSAMNSAEGQVQNLQYTATFPLLINVANQPTYFMALKDDAGLVKKFAMIDIRRYQNVAVGDTVAETQKTYETLLATNGVDTTGGVVAETESAKGVITHITDAVLEGNSHFYVKIQDDAAVYDFALPELIDIVGYKEGDVIEFNYLPVDGSVQPAESIGAPKAKAEDAAEDATDNGEAAAGSGTVEGPEDAQVEPEANAA